MLRDLNSLKDDAVIDGIRKLVVNNTKSGQVGLNGLIKPSEIFETAFQEVPWKFRTEMWSCVKGPNIHSLQSFEEKPQFYCL